MTKYKKYSKYEFDKWCKSWNIDREFSDKVWPGIKPFRVFLDVNSVDRWQLIPDELVIRIPIKKEEKPNGKEHKGDK